MTGTCDRCEAVKDIGQLCKLTCGWGGRRTGETVCYACKRPNETWDAASD